MATYQVNKEYSISKDETFYAVTKQNISLEVVGNGAFRGTKYFNCEVFNTNQCCSVTLPGLEHDSYTIVGFHEKEDEITILYQDNETIELF